jgi:hypothetical protein
MRLGRLMVGRVGLRAALRILSRLFGAALVVGAVIGGVESWTLYADGTAATATVQRQAGEAKEVRYLLSFVGRDGVTRSEWVHIHGGEGLRVGEQVGIRYAPADPGKLIVTRDLLSTAVYGPITILFAAAIFLLVLPAVARDPEREPHPPSV